VSKTLRSALVGLLVGTLLVAGAAALLVWGPWNLPGAARTDRVLVVCAVPDETGTEVAGLVFVVDAGSNTLTPLDPFAAGTVSGTSAANAREALPFGGGGAVASALASQVGEPAMPWVVLPADEWGKLVDEAGGLEARIPTSISSYSEGTLTVFGPEDSTLTGEGAVALVGSSAFLESAARDDVINQLTAGVGTIVSQSGSRVRSLVGGGAATSSLQAREIPSFRLAQ